MMIPRLFPLDLKGAPGAALLARVRQQTSPQFVALETRLERTFLVGAPSAPGFCCLGGEIAVDPDAAQAFGAARVSVTGTGETLDEAVIGCLGEAADRLSHVGRAEDIHAASAVRNPVTDGWIAQILPPDIDGVDWMPARDAASDAVAALPADVCIRRAVSRRRVKPAGALSSGVAAGPDLRAAALRAGLELCERDALALWWIGGQRPRGVPIEHAANVAATRLLANLRQDRTDRLTRLLDITTDLEIPAIAAVSIDRDGCGLACGLAARLDWGEAARAAIFEMCQMELAAPIAHAKRRERGEEALNEIDRNHLRRAAFATSGCDLLEPRGPASPQSKADTSGDPLHAFVTRLSGHGVRLFVLDLTRPDIGIPVVRMVSPDLQPYTSGVVTERLRRTRAANGGGNASAASISLM